MYAKCRSGLKAKLQFPVARAQTKSLKSEVTASFNPELLVLIKMCTIIVLLIINYEQIKNN